MLGLVMFELACLAIVLEFAYRAPEEAALSKRATRYRPSPCAISTAPRTSATIHSRVRAAAPNISAVTKSRSRLAPTGRSATPFRSSLPAIADPTEPDQ